MRSTPPPPPAASSGPARLGRWSVGAKIGGGGMATVYVGTSAPPGGPRELAALKVIRDEYVAEEHYVAMFLDEAKILSRMSHPHLIRTHEYGTQGRHCFIAMELLSGRSLADLWDRCAAVGRRMPLGLGAWICARVAEGLHEAHELRGDDGEPLGVVHRDVNPSNVFLTYGGDVKLIDFGLAKARGRRTKSQEGIVKGKLPYLAPEQARQEALDRRIDVFALGTTLWELGTMRRLFKREDDAGTLKAVLDCDVPDPRTVVERYPDTLARHVLRALAPAPADRFPTSRELGEALDAFVAETTERDMREHLAAMIEEAFPGEQARQAAWLERATAAIRTAPALTLPPPVPVPSASSSLLEDVPTSEPELAAAPSASAPSRPPPAPFAPALPPRVSFTPPRSAPPPPVTPRSAPPPPVTPRSIPAPPATPRVLTPPPASSAGPASAPPASAPAPSVPAPRSGPAGARRAAPDDLFARMAKAPPTTWLSLGLVVAVAAIALAVAASVR